jgi:sodium/potassium-transporting ATPase subunit alpha
VFMGSSVLEGEGKGVVIETGNRTVVGKITTMTMRESSDPSIKDITYFVKIVVAVAFITGIFVIILWASWLRVDYPGFLTVAGN